MTDELIEFDWDSANIRHIGRHKVLPREVEEAFASKPFDLEFEFIDGEDRWTSTGHTRNLRVLLIVWTMRRGRVRVVTARQAGEPLRKTYLKEKGFPI